MLNKWVSAKRWIVAVGLGIVLVLLGAGLIARTMYLGAITAEALEQRITADVPRRFAVITGSDLRDVGMELRYGRRKLTQLHDRAQRHLEREAAAAEVSEHGIVPDPRLMQEVTRLHAVLRLFDRWLMLWQEAPLRERERVAGDIILEVLQERVAWSYQYGAGGGQNRMRAPAVLRKLHGGISAAALWPARLVMGLRYMQQPVYMFRNIFFPDTSRTALRFWHLLGFFPIALTMGYSLCWLGERCNQAVLSFAGVAYFLYTGIYMMCVLLAAGGLV